MRPRLAAQRNCSAGCMPDHAARLARDASRKMHYFLGGGGGGRIMQNGVGALYKRISCRYKAAAKHDSFHIVCRYCIISCNCSASGKRNFSTFSGAAFPDSRGTRSLVCDRAGARPSRIHDRAGSYAEATRVARESDRSRLLKRQESPGKATGVACKSDWGRLGKRPGSPALATGVASAMDRKVGETALCAI